MNEKLIVLGFDGMDIRYLRKAMEERELPNFERLRDEGVLGTLESCHPPTTMPAWLCMFQGKNPGKIGIFHFQELDPETGSFSPHDVSEQFGSYVWDTGIETGLAFVPAISPPYEINGQIVEGIPGPEDFRTYPEDLKGDLVSREELDVFEQEFFDRMDKYMNYFNVRKKVVRRLIDQEEQELLVTVYRPTDAVAHFGDSMEDFYEVYEAMDEELGYFLDKVEEDGSNLLMVADHGANETQEAFFMNTWLEKNDYLSLNEEGESAENRKIIKVADLLMKLGLRKPLEKIHDVLNHFTGVNMKPQKSSVSDQVDWENTEAMAHLIGALPTMGVSINEKNVDNVEEKQQELVEALEERDEVVWAKTREELYSGDGLDKLPHVVIRAHDDIMMKAMIYPEVTTKFNKYGHGYNGVFGAYGTDIENLDGFDAHIFDIGPTILHLFDEKVPGDMDGKVLEELLDTGREVEFGDPIEGKISSREEERDEEIKDRLEEMGYMRD